MISLILAQRDESLKVIGIELDRVSAGQADYNFKVSPFSDRIQIINADCLQYAFSHKYDLIVCNPPYFVGGTLPHQSHLSVAKHSNKEFMPKLFKKVEGLLSPMGKFQFLYPSSEDSKTESLIARSSLNLVKKTLLKSYSESEPYATIYTVQREATDIIIDSLVLYQIKRVFTEAHHNLTKEFYLNK